MTTATQQTASERYRERIIKRAEQCFENHVCEQTLNAGNWKAWTCAAPGTLIHAFHITLKPGLLVMDGDLGFIAFSRWKELNMIPWLRGAIDSLDYLAQSVPPEITVRDRSKQLTSKFLYQCVALKWWLNAISQDAAHASR